MTDYKQLCAELLDYWDNDCPVTLAEVMERARAALAEPEPEGPTDEQLIEAYQRSYQPAWERGEHYGCHIDGLRAVLARWGNRQGSLDSST